VLVSRHLVSASSRCCHGKLRGRVFSGGSSRVSLERGLDVPAAEMTQYAGIPATTVQRALHDMKDRMPPDRWLALVDAAVRRELVDA
jgi:hypothetical protein